jgi:hypothetical protein
VIFNLIEIMESLKIIKLTSEHRISLLLVYMMKKNSL